MRTTLKIGAGMGVPEVAAGHVGAGGGGEGRGGGGGRRVGPLSDKAVYGDPRRGGWGRAGRVLAWLVVVLLVVAGGAGGGIWLYLNEEIVAKVTPGKDSDISKEAVKDDLALPPTANEPATALIIGYDLRKGADAAGFVPRSDTIMLLRADPSRDVLTLLSLPRDLWVDHPGCKATGEQGWRGRINEAYERCKARGVIRTVQELTKVRINYVITLNFAAFRGMVDKVGGVFVDVDHHYFNDVGGPGGYATIDLPPGYQRLSGTQALDYARYRHGDNDVFRNARQQEFLKAFKDKVGSALSPTKLPGFIQAVVADDNLKIQQGGSKNVPLETLLRYARFLYDLGGGGFYQVKLGEMQEDTTPDGAKILIASPETIRVAVNEFLRPDVDVAEDATAVATGTGLKAPLPAQTTIAVLNGNGVVGAAADAAQRLRDRGYVAESSPDDAGTEFDTKVLFDPAIPGARVAAEKVAKLFDGVVAEAPPEEQIQTLLQVVVGKTYQNAIAPGAADRTPQAGESTALADGELRDLLRGIQANVGFTLLAPARRDAQSVLVTDQLRTYRLNGGFDAVRIVYRRGLIAYWGIQQTAWTKAPILEGASVERKIGKRKYRLFFSGPRLHTVAFVEGGAAYWVTNTLDDALSNETMLDVAKSLRPVATRR